MVSWSVCGHSGHVTAHLPHLLMLALPLLAFVGVFGVQWRAAADEPMPASLWWMGALTTAAGGVHGGVVAHHAREGALLGWAMAVMCLGQLAWVVTLLFRPTRRTVEVGVLGNLGIVALWAYTRAFALPFAIAPVQRIGGWDLTCTLVEVGALAAGLAHVYGATGSRSPESEPWSKWEKSTTRNSPPPRNASSPVAALVPSQVNHSLRPSNRSTFATRS